MGLVNHATSARYVETIGQRLVRNSLRQAIDYHFHVGSVATEG